MLLQLSIKNIALVEDLTIEFTPGLNVLTGETGAGKSIVIDSMNLSLGERADKSLIRAGESKAQVETLFDVAACGEAEAMLLEQGIDTEDGQLVVARELSASGRNIVRLNGTLVPLSTLKQLSSFLVDVHGQHEHQSLLNEEKHLAYLDGYAIDALLPLQKETAQLYAAWRERDSRLRRIVNGAQQRAQRLDMLEYQIQEIEAAKLVPGEEDELEQKRQFYRNAGRIAEGLAGAQAALDGDEQAPGAADALRQAIACLSGVTRYIEALGEAENGLTDALYALEDAASQIKDQLDNMEFDERDADRVENRLEEIKRLKRKYGGSITAILAYYDGISEELAALQADENDSSSLEAETQEAEARLTEAELRLREARKRAAEGFSRDILVQLADLGMAQASFQVEFDSLPENRADWSRLHSASGLDCVRFLLSANRGEPLKPLSRTASGGELSRIMLAFKTICAGDVGTMVFDEIDTGISGRMAQVVGEKLAAIGREKQVICVTHSPQIAALGDSHHLVRKTTDGQRTFTKVDMLGEDQRVEEIARILGGREMTKATLDHAAELRRLARQE